LAGEIKECIRWQVICVDPEHLRDREWREITAYLQDLEGVPNIALWNSIRNLGPPAKILKKENTICENSIAGVKVILV
jgi:hypothetical protein